MKSHREINFDLFYQLDLEDIGYEKGRLADDYPFALRSLGEIESRGVKCQVYEFFLNDMRFLFVDTDTGLILGGENGFNLVDLQAQLIGEEWIYPQKPIELNTSDLSDDSLPRAVERRQMVESLFRSAFPMAGVATVLEGQYLRLSGETVGVVRDEVTGKTWMVASCFAPIEARYIWERPDWGVSPVLAIAIGMTLRR